VRSQAPCRGVAVASPAQDLRSPEQKEADEWKSKGENMGDEQFMRFNGRFHQQFGFNLQELGLNQQELGLKNKNRFTISKIGDFTC
jgi:hypothetical protein